MLKRGRYPLFGMGADVDGWAVSSCSASISPRSFSYSAILRCKNRRVSAAFSDTPVGVSK